MEMRKNSPVQGRIHRAPGIELDAATQGLNRLLDHVETVINGPEIDVRSRPQRIQARYLPKMVRRTLEIVNQETNGGQTVMHVRSVGLQRQGLEIELPRL